jgi:hypothetical protein
MMTHCLAGMATFGPGWTLTALLIAATVAGTYLLTRRADGRAERTPA